jgi:hypothetical protein
MEVHHHAHHAPGDTHIHQKKRWGSFFWEFFMLFLAVFCGMLAEYKLEHIVEHQREKKYISSLVKDIELDIASLQASYNYRKLEISYFDSLIGLLRHGYENRMNDFYFYARHITRVTPFQYHDRTIQQLKNSGNLRLIRNQDASDSITVYDNEKIKISLNQLDAENELRKYISYNLGGKIFDPFAWNDMTDSTGKIRRLAYNPSLITKDPILLNELGFKAVTLKGHLLATNRAIAGALISAKNLIQLLKKEYHLE